jgi:hypothetical protein
MTAKLFDFPIPSPRSANPYRAGAPVGNFLQESIFPQSRAQEIGPTTGLMSVTHASERVRHEFQYSRNSGQLDPAIAGR